MPGLEQLEQIAQGVAAVQNILHHDDILALDALREVLGDLHLTGRGSAGAVRGYGHEVQGAGEGDGAHQIRHKDKGAPEDADENGLPARVVPVNLFGQLLYSGAERLFGE